MIREVGGHKPKIHPTAFVHETAEVIGKVTLEKDSSVWPYAVLRGDIAEARRIVSARSVERAGDR
jgi:carbonic anhydrase/acetyltransferase-like protein (isoleucine patch superfamily)